MEIKNNFDDIILPATERDIDKILSDMNFAIASPIRLLINGMRITRSLKSGATIL
jgi:hypothetical protein